jgi:phage recombination protein Bet
VSNLITTQIDQLAVTFDLPKSAELYEVLKATAFKGEVSDAQLSALLIVANQYKLNPWTKEIYAFPDKKNGIIPVVSVDGWARIINSNLQYDGMEFNVSDEMIALDGTINKAPAWTECVIYRKDRAHPTKIREYIDEVYKPPFKSKDGYLITGPWQTHPKRFSRHKAMIQCARMAFGFGGIYDEDEATRIADAKQPPKDMGMVEELPPKAPPAYSTDKFNTNLPAWLKSIAEGKATPDKIIAKLRTIGTLTQEQIDAISKPAKPVVTFAQVAEAMVKAANADALDAAADLIGEVADVWQREELSAQYEARKAEFEGAPA